MCRETAGDITARKLAEREIEHLHRVLFSIRNVNSLITREKEPYKLIQGICELLIEQQGYPGAMIVMADEAGKIGIYSATGMGAKFKPLAESLDKGELPPCCSGAKAIDGIYYVKLPSPQLERNSGAARGSGGYLDYPVVRCAPCPMVSLCSRNKTMCVSLLYHGNNMGYLVVLVESSHAIGKEEQALFLDVAGDVAVALHSLSQAETVRQSEEKRAAVEVQLRQAQKMEVVGQLASGIAHDFNNILGAIEGYASIVLNGLAADNPIRPDLEEILKAERRAVALTKQLMLFSRKQSVQKTTVELNRLIMELEEMAKRLIGENITLEVSSAPDLKPVLADVGLLEQVLINLLVNARDAMPGGGLLKVTTVNVDISRAARKCPEPVEPGRQFVKISVADSGAGMDRNTLDHLFEPFFTTKPRGTGTGLGLSIVYGIVKQHNGWIDVHSEEEKGSVFTVYLPQAPAGTVNETVPEEAARDLRGHGERVLVVEDDETLRKITVRALKENGYDPVEARTVSEAVGIVSGKNANFRIIFTDMILSDRNGTELINDLKKVAPGINFVFTSGYLADKIKLEFIQNQGYKFIQKPYSTETVLKIFNELLSKCA